MGAVGVHNRSARDPCEVLDNKQGQGTIPCQVAVLARLMAIGLLQLHAKVQKKAIWGAGVQKFAWRIDVKSKARNISEMAEPVAIVELTLGKKVPD